MSKIIIEIELTPEQEEVLKSKSWKNQPQEFIDELVEKKILSWNYPASFYEQTQLGQIIIDTLREEYQKEEEDLIRLTW